jgi:hypothetical protein
LVVRSITNAAGNVVFTWPSVAGKLYTVISTTNLLPTIAWTNRLDYVDQPGSGGTLSYTSSVSVPETLFRIRVR